MSWSSSLPSTPAFQRLADAVDDDPDVVAVALAGPDACGAIPDNAPDLLIVVATNESSGRWHRFSSDGFDIRVLTCDTLERIPTDPGQWWDRYLIGHARVVLDRSGGQVPRLLERWAWLDDRETDDAIDFYLDPYLTYTYRALREHEVGMPEAARFEAAESLPWTVRLMFALHSRSRPTARCLRFELDRQPFDEPGWDAERLYRLYNDLVDTGDAATIRELFGLIEPMLRRRGFGGALEGYGAAVALLHARPA